MNKEQIVRIGGIVTLLVMAVTCIAFLRGGAAAIWPNAYIFAIAAWLHGICWGYCYAVKGRLTWW